MFFGYYKRVPRIVGVNIKKGKGVLIFIYFLRRNISFNNFAKQAIIHYPYSMIKLLILHEVIMSTHTSEKIHTDTDNGLDGYPALLQTLLRNRNITKKEDVEMFLNPDYDNHIHDPFLLPDMDKAVERILRALKNNERIAIFSDFDCDGIPGGVVLHDFFKKIGYENFTNYIPHRHEEGYGLNTRAIDKLKEEGVLLMITVDVGITDVAQVEHANSLGIDVIVTDHHLPGEALPPAHAVVNPKRKDNTYPFDGLCGAGVAFKLVQALIQKGDTRFGGEHFTLKEGWEKWLLDVAGLATIADMVPLTGENRVLAHYGLKVLRKSPRPGLMKLCRKMNVKQREITEDDVGFMIAPRINAASRMDRPEDAFHLLATTEDEQGGMYAEHLHKINNERKGVVASVVREAKKELEARDLQEVIVIGNPKWKPSLLGLVANTLVETYERPVCLWGEEGGSVLKGSCRSDGTVNIVELMEYAKSNLIEFGGHQFSAGFSVLRDQVHTLEDAFVNAYKEVANGEIQEKQKVDATLWLDDVTWDTYRLLDKLAPFGEGNPKPVFLFENVEVASTRHFGKTQNHLEVRVVNGSGVTIPAIAFFRTEESFAASLTSGSKINLTAHIERSTFGRRPELRLRIIDIQ